MYRGRDAREEICDVSLKKRAQVSGDVQIVEVKISGPILHIRLLIRRV